MRLKICGIAFAVACLASLPAAKATVVINEVLGSTSGSDWEFIELFNSGGSSQDISGWEIELWDSDSGSSGQDAESPYIIPAATTLNAGEFYTLGNPNAVAGYGAGPFDDTTSLDTSSIENSSYTIVLADGNLGNIVNSVFVTDGGAGDAATRNGAGITADATVGPAGSFLPAGFYRTTDGGATLAVLNFSTGDLNNGTSEGGTPGASNVISAIPEPSSLTMASLLGIGILGLRRRRRK